MTLAAHKKTVRNENQLRISFDNYSNAPGGTVTYRLRNDLKCVEWDVKCCSTNQSAQLPERKMRAIAERLRDVS